MIAKDFRSGRAFTVMAEAPAQAATMIVDAYRRIAQLPVQR